MNIDLGEGQSATLRERLTYGQARGVRAAYFAQETNPIAKADLDLALVRAYVSGWTVMDTDGRAVSLDTPELAPDDVIQVIAKEAADLFGGTDLPKAGDGSLASTPPVSPSDPINGSATSSSSTLTPAGPGLT
jgi:hypothetical protein